MAHSILRRQKTNNKQARMNTSSNRNKRARVETEQSLHCAVCLEIMSTDDSLPASRMENKVPRKLLQCAHSFCTHCLFQLATSTSAFSRPPVSSSSSLLLEMSVCCPLCMKVSVMKANNKEEAARQLSKDFNLMETIEMKTVYSAAASLKCVEDDSHIATVYCEDCRANFCTECCAMAHKSKALQAHNRMQIDAKQQQQQTASSRPGTATTICSKHNEKLLLYCQNDRIPICTVCDRTEHKGHSTDLASNIAKEAKQELQNTQQQINVYFYLYFLFVRWLMKYC